MAKVPEASAPAAPEKVVKAAIDPTLVLENLRKDVGDLHDRFGRVLDYLKGLAGTGHHSEDLP